MIFIVALLLRAEIGQAIQHTSDIMCIARCIDSRSSTIFEAAADFDLELIESRTLDGRTQDLLYRPTLHG